MVTLHIEGKHHTYSFHRSVFAPVESNMYILFEGEEAIVFDTNISDDVLALLNANNVQKVHVFLTHEHYDHAHGVWWLREHFDTILYCHLECKGNISTKKRSSPRLVAFVISVKDMNDGGNRYDAFKESIVDYAIEADEYFEDGHIFSIGTHTIRCVHTPGHTPGSCLFIMDEELVFSGDSMIEGNKIITGFRGGDKERMINEALPKLKALPDDLWVMPGHGEPFKKKDFNFNIYDNV